MKIIYAENPLETLVELDDIDRKALKNSIELDELDNVIHEIGCNVTEKCFNLDRARNAYEEYLENGAFRKRIEEMTIEAEKELKMNHAGDCVCAPCSCFKCYAEVRLGIDTIPKLSPRGGYTIHSIFHNNKEITTCSQAIEFLEGPLILSPDYEAYREQIIKDRAETLEWLKNYQKNYLNIEKTRKEFKL